MLVFVAKYFLKEQLLSFVQILFKLNLPDITSKRRTVAMFAIIDFLRYFIHNFVGVPILTCKNLEVCLSFTFKHLILVAPMVH